MFVRFRNLSINGNSYTWDFGDKSYSNEKEPVHTYYIPGNYIVSLSVSNYSGVSVFKAIIKVYQNPVSQFDVYPTEVINNSQVVVFQNFSFYGDTYVWSFGDGESSSEENPWHKYKDEGTYNVRLYVTSKDGCTDSSFYRSPVVVDYKEGNIRFANAFRWNLSGPTGGYWEDGGLSDEVFRPFFVNVVDYHLQVFNRWGGTDL